MATRIRSEHIRDESVAAVDIDGSDAAAIRLKLGITAGGETFASYHGAFCDTTNQIVSDVSSSYAITYNNTLLTNGISVISSSQITFDNPGIYNLQFSIQLINSSTNEHDVNIWLRKNGVNVNNTDSHVTVPGKHGNILGHIVPAWNFFEQVNANDYLQLMWQSDSTDIIATTIADDITLSIPAAPSVILTVHQVASELNSILNAMNELTASADTFIYFTGATTATTASLTSAARSFLDDATPADQRSTLQLGTAALANTGTLAGNVIALDESARLPAVDGSQLLNIAGSGTITGSTGDTDNRILRADGAGGVTIQSSVVSIDDSGNMSGIGNITLSGTVDGVDISALSVSLGTAAYVNTGTQAGNVVVLDGSAKLPAVDGSALTNLAPYAADSWNILNWTAGSNTMATDGWTYTTGSGGSLTDISETIGGITARKLTPAANNFAYYEQAVLPPSGSWECRIRAYLPQSDADGDPFYGIFLIGQSGGIQNGYYRRLGLAFIAEGSVTSGIGYWSGSALTAWAGGWSGNCSGMWVDWTFRFRDHAASKVNSMEIWLGPNLLGVFPTTTSGGTTAAAPFNAQAGTANAIRVGKLNGTSGTGAMYFHSIKVRSGLNEAPPNWTFRSYNGGVGP